MKKLLLASALPLCLLASACGTDGGADAMNKILDAPASPERCAQMSQVLATLDPTAPEMADARRHAQLFLDTRCSPQGRRHR